VGRCRHSRLWSDGTGRLLGCITLSLSLKALQCKINIGTEDAHFRFSALVWVRITLSYKCVIGHSSTDAALRVPDQWEGCSIDGDIERMPKKTKSVEKIYFRNIFSCVSVRKTSSSFLPSGERGRSGWKPQMWGRGRRFVGFDESPWAPHAGWMQAHMGYTSLTSRRRVPAEGKVAAAVKSTRVWTFGIVRVNSGYRGTENKGLQEQRGLGGTVWKRTKKKIKEMYLKAHEEENSGNISENLWRRKFREYIWKLVKKKIQGIYLKIREGEN
jgi:hypothetical protein